VATFALAIGVITASGCGGGGTPKPLTDSEFVSRANGVCADVYKQYAHADFDAKAGVLTDGAEKLKELVPPAAKKRAFQRFLKALGGEADAWQAMTKGTGGSDLTDRFIAQESQISSSATAMGTKKCTTVAGRQ
jgi:hypothetical protein